MNKFLKSALNSDNGFIVKIYFEETVTVGKITDGSVTTVKIAADAITGAQIADNAIATEHIFPSFLLNPILIENDFE